MSRDVGDRLIASYRPPLGHYLPCSRVGCHAFPHLHAEDWRAHSLERQRALGADFSARIGRLVGAP